jgi:DNA-binding NarL/FixJ family response regulator
VLLDLDMPESGFHALLELVPDRQHPPIAVVILTRLVHPSLSELAKYNGAQGWLVKQHTSPEKLCAAIQQAMSFVKSTRKH